MFDPSYDAFAEWTALCKKHAAFDFHAQFRTEKKPTEWYDIAHNHDPEASKGMKHLLVLIIYFLVYAIFKKNTKQ